jgi:signal transduction histidine kinase
MQGALVIKRFVTEASARYRRETGAGVDARSTLIDRDRLARALPFAAIAVAGQISAAWPPGPSNLGQFWISTALLVLAALLLVVPLPRPVDPVLGAASLYVVSVAFLMLANGGLNSSGFGSLFYVAVVAVALYGRPRDSVIVVSLVVLMLFIVSLAGQVDVASTARRLSLLAGIAGVLSFSIHALRDRLIESNERTTNLLHQAQSINAAAERLASLLDPTAIAALGTELAARSAATPESRLGRARYLRLDAGRVVVEAEFGGSGQSAARPASLDLLSPLGHAAQTLQPVTGTVNDLRAMPQERVRNAAWVPVTLSGRLHGILEVVSPSGPVTRDCVERCVALGHLLELALSNWTAHEELEQAGRAEERRRIARDLHDGLAHELAFIASKARGAGGDGSSIDTRELVGAADRALDEARRAITVLSSSAPQSLVTAVTQTAEDLGSRLRIPVLLDLGDDVDASPQVTEHVLRIVREAITNAANHAQANFVEVSLRRDDGLRLVVQDDGCGFDPDHEAGTGFGLLSMRERADSIGAGFVIASAPSHGTRIEVALP